MLSSQQQHEMEGDIRDKLSRTVLTLSRCCRYFMRPRDSQFNMARGIALPENTHSRNPENRKNTLMAIELTKWCGRQKTKQPDTFRAPLIVQGFKHIVSIHYPTFSHRHFMLNRRDQLPR
jgi:hypothetical protein